MTDRNVPNLRFIMPATNPALIPLSTMQVFTDYPRAYQAIPNCWQDSDLLSFYLDPDDLFCATEFGESMWNPKKNAWEKTDG